MPNIQLIMIDDRMFNFSSSEYFIYPTHTNLTFSVQSILGLSVLQLELENTRIKTNIDKFYFGQLFVQKYGLVMTFYS